jgi:hypothetical protein
MIECPSSTAIDKYTDEEQLIPVSDVEISVVMQKPLTANLRGTLRRLRSVGGFFSPWRGLHMYIVYTVLHWLVSNFLWHIVCVFIYSPWLGYTMSSVGAYLLLARVHLLWTHTIIASPSSKSLRERIIPRALCAPIMLPTLVVAAAQNATILIPLGVAYQLDLFNVPDNAWGALKRDDDTALIMIALRILAVVLTSALLALFVLLPAVMTLARIEAFLLPLDTPPLVPVAALSLDSATVTNTALFLASWRSITRSAITRVLKVYAKMLGVQFFVALVGVLVMALEVYLIGGERLRVLYTSVRAHIELALMRN